MHSLLKEAVQIAILVKNAAGIFGFISSDVEYKRNVNASLEITVTALRPVQLRKDVRALKRFNKMVPR